MRGGIQGVPESEEAGLMTPKEINIALAERVLGWQPHEGREAIVVFGRALDEQLAHYDRIWVKERMIMACEQCGNLPDFCVDPEWSGTIRAKLAEKYDWLLGYGRTRPDEKLYGFALYEKETAPFDERYQVCIAEADTEEMAVALCALRSVGVDVDGWTFREC